MAGLEVGEIHVMKIGATKEVGFAWAFVTVAVRDDEVKGWSTIRLKLPFRLDQEETIGRTQARVRDVAVEHLKAAAEILRAASLTPPPPRAPVEPSDFPAP